MQVEVTNPNGQQVPVVGDAVGRVRVTQDAQPTVEDRLNRAIAVLAAEMRELRRVVCAASNQPFLDLTTQEP